MDPVNTSNPVLPITAPSAPVVPSQPMQPPIVPSIPPTPVPAKPKHKFLKWAGIAFGVIACFVGVVFLLAYIATSAPVKVAKEQFSDIKANNLQAAYGLFSTAAQSQVSFDNFQTFVSTYNLTDPNISPSFSSRQVVNSDAQLDGKIVVAGTTFDLHYELSKEGNDWKVTYVKVTPK